MVDGKTTSTGVRVAGLSDIGVVREENQDTLLIREPVDEKTRSSRGVLLAVADGMGGLQDGKIASRLAINTLADSYYSVSGDAPQALTGSVEAANRVIFDYSRHEAGGQRPTRPARRPAARSAQVPVPRCIRRRRPDRAATHMR